MLEPFLLIAWAAGIGISLMSGPLGCLIVWQRLAYFGDTVAHAAMLGVVLALLADVGPLWGVVLMALFLAYMVSRAPHAAGLSNDSLLGIASHSALALALVILALSPSITIDINGLLFGDILAVSRRELLVIYALAVVVLAVLAAQWKQCIRYVLHADIAQVEGLNMPRMRLLIMGMIALVVAVSIKLVGVLLITALLILPAATARRVAQSPTQMALWATVFSAAAVTLGLLASYGFDTPTGPTIILSALAIFIVSRVCSG